MNRDQMEHLSRLLDKGITDNKATVKYYAAKAVERPHDLPMFGEYTARLHGENEVLTEVHRELAGMLEWEADAVEEAALLRIAIGATTSGFAQSLEVHRREGNANGLNEVVGLIDRVKR